MLMRLSGLVLSALIGWSAFAKAQEVPVIATQSDASDETPSLDDLRWVSRAIVVFADSANDPRFEQQVRMLEERAAELEDRDAVVLFDTDPAAGGPLRQALRPRDFNLVLIDKNGSVVQRRPAPTTARELINLIDRLPSRRQETGSRRQ